MILVLLSFLIIAIYTGVMIQREKEVPYSISATYYSLKNKFWFGTCMIGASLLLLPSALDVSTEDSQFLVFLSVVGMAVLGVSPNFKTEQKTPHVIGACMSLIFSQIWVGCNAWYWLLLWAVFIVYVIVSMKKNWKGNFIVSFINRKPMFWVEIVSLLTVYLTCIV
ncbi:glycosyl transferase [Bacteroides ovatus]|uniref:glycosyl transferase n=1 Tax=Bacteroides ovatus TaxID=28116 RepID=UPI00189A2D02|nr:glycosyl transferase [Bacteroides ovatus]MDC2623586.1 glycosyl transferase [Bacteroides ovatus]MDC2637541.1 glycosyl transferase [Bacteroides ovatus]MDC2652712.1 glycosyl transferase [Bacteroides ovatus]